ncbi:MAG: hypothetical protein M9894_15635 [Planctomycetes bacterium]|nr:hypothetical protein [Planctomycetota bacterium]
MPLPRAAGLSRLALAALVLAAAARVAAAASTWGLDWLSDDWVLLAAGQAGAWPLEPAHVSVPRDLLLLLADAGPGPWLVRAVALLAHLAAALWLLPRVAVGLAGPEAAGPGRAAGLGVLALPATLDPLVWPCTAGYALLEASLLALALAHLAWVARGGGRLRAASLAATTAALLTWDFAATAPALVAALSWGRGRAPGEAARDAAPHVALVAAWALLKLALGSTEVPDLRDPARVAGNVAFTPLLLLAPWPLERGLLLSAAGGALALVALGAAALAARRAGRPGAALLALVWLPLTPVLAGPGPESRYLLLSAPWAALLLALAWPRARAALALALVAWAAAAGVTSWRAALRWREGAAEARAVVDAVAAAADGRPVVVLDAPDRLPGWGPTWKVPVWRFGLAEALARRGVVLAARAHRPPLDPERHGLRPSTPPCAEHDVQAWRARGWRVLAWDPARRAVVEPSPP